MPVLPAEEQLALAEIVDRLIAAQRERSSRQRCKRSGSTTIGLFSIAPGFSLGYGLGIMEVNGLYDHKGAILGFSTCRLHSPAPQATIVPLANRGVTETEFAGPIATDMVHLL